MSLFKLCSFLYGIVFLALGIFGFIPYFVREELLFGVFKTNLMINIIHLLTGAIGLWEMAVRKYYTRLYFQIVGFIYAFLAVLGFIYGENSILGFIGNNFALTWFHVVAAIVALILGFGTNNKLDKDAS